MLAIYKKEMRSYFINPIGYIFVGVFLTAAAALCCYTTLQQRSYGTSSFFYYMMLIMMVLIPILTMRTFSEEKKMRTEQMLLTSPVTITGMVMGKYLAAFTVFGVSVLVSCVNFIPLFILGREEAALSDNAYATVQIGPNGAQIIGSLLGILLIGAAFIAIGILISAMTENQLSAVIITIAVLVSAFLLNMVNNIGSEEEGTRLISNYAVRYVIDWISIVSRFSLFRYGILDWSAVVYYASVAFLFIFLTVRVYERRRWA